MESMKAVPFLISALFIASSLDYKAAVSEQPQMTEHAPVAQAKTKYSFTPVKEILSRSCTPCHVPGGKMYGTMPFDNADVVRSHSDGILSRIKKTEDKKLIEHWLSEPIN
jgi:hypothetical protein